MIGGPFRVKKMMPNTKKKKEKKEKGEEKTTNVPLSVLGSFQVKSSID